MKEHMAIVLWNLGATSVPTQDREFVIVSTSSGQLLLGKHLRVFGDVSSPKRLKLALTLRCTTLEATAMGFNEVTQEELHVKRKRGCSVGAKNKKEKVVKKAGLELLRLTYPIPSFASPCPSAKGIFGANVKKRDKGGD